MSKIEEPAPAPVFPYWPFSCMAFYSHLAQDFGRCVQNVGTCADPVQAARAEGDYGVSLWRDTMQAYYELALMPLSAMARTLSPSAGGGTAEGSAKTDL